jgi:hypothetical protein
MLMRQHKTGGKAGGKQEAQYTGKQPDDRDAVVQFKPEGNKFDARAMPPLLTRWLPLDKLADKK